MTTIHPTARSARSHGRRHTAYRSAVVLVAAAALASAPAATGAATAVPSSATCAVTWGSLAKTSAPLRTGSVAGVRTGRHLCFDRLVVDLTGRPPGYDVRYVSTVYSEGGGFPVGVAGGARLAVVVRKGATRIPAMPSVGGYPTFRQIRWAGSFEGYTTLALGVRARLPFRAFTIDDTATGRSRLVIDVAHHW